MAEDQKQKGDSLNPTVDAAGVTVETVPANEQPADESTAQIQQQFDESLARGYEGVNPVADALPNSVWSQQSGPDSPTITTTTGIQVVEPPSSGTTKTSAKKGS